MTDQSDDLQIWDILDHDWGVWRGATPAEAVAAALRDQGRPAEAVDNAIVFDLEAEPDMKSINVDGMRFGTDRLVGVYVRPPIEPSDTLAWLKTRYTSVGWEPISAHAKAFSGRGIHMKLSLSFEYMLLDAGDGWFTVDPGADSVSEGLIAPPVTLDQAVMRAERIGLDRLGGSKTKTDEDTQALEALNTLQTPGARDEHLKVDYGTNWDEIDD